MATWWLTEAVDIEVTALLPIVAFPLLGVAPLSKVLPPYAADVIFLFMGGFIIGLAIERWGLDRRIAFFTLRVVGARPSAIVGGFMAGHRFPEHVGVEHRVRSDDGAHRLERDRSGPRKPHRA
jgi:sodium-dependent dicarboxylate transporter 2/3/5